MNAAPGPKQPTPATERLSRADEVYFQLKRDVGEFRLVPGDRFTENEVCERLGVSRTPVRQALVRLQQEGYVEVLFRSGWRVLPFDFVRFEQLYDLRMVLGSSPSATLEPKNAPPRNPKAIQRPLARSTLFSFQ